MCISTRPQPRLGRQLEQRRVGGAADVVDRRRRRRRAPARATSAEKVSAEIGSSVRAASPSIAGTSCAASSSAGTGGPLRAATAPTSSMSKPGLGQGEPVLDRLLGGAAARALEQRVVGDVDDPGPERPLELERPVRRAARRAAGPSRLRVALAARWPSAASTPISTGPCSAATARSSATPRASSRCCRPGRSRPATAPEVEIVIKSGRREAQVLEDARLIGQTLLHLRGRLRRW